MAVVLGVTIAGFFVVRALTTRDARGDSVHRAEVAAAPIRDRLQQATSLTQLNYEGHNVSAIVRRTGRPVRLEDLTDAGGSFVDVFRGLGASALVGTPIVVEGRLWGTIVASWDTFAPLFDAAVEQGGDPFGGGLEQVLVRVRSVEHGERSVQACLGDERSGAGGSQAGKAPAGTSP